MTTVSAYTPSPLQQAIENNDLTEACKLIATEPYSDIENGQTHLERVMHRWSCLSELFGPLVKGRGKDVLEYANRDGLTPMILAAGMANVKAIDLLAEAGAPVCTYDKLGGTTPLHQLVRFGLPHAKFMWRGCLPSAHAQILEAAKVLVRYGALANDDTLERGLVGEYIPHWGSNEDEGASKVVEFLVAEGAVVPSTAQVLVANLKDAAKISAAIKRGLAERRRVVQPAIASALDRLLCDPLVRLIRDYELYYEPSDLRSAIEGLDPVEALTALREGSSCPPIEDGSTNFARGVIRYSHANPQPQLLELLVAGLSPDYLNFVDEDGSGMTPMHWAALNGNVIAIERLAEAGAKVDVYDSKGWSPLHALIDSAASKIDTSSDDRTKALAQVLKAAQTLVRYGARANDYNSKDGTALLESYVLNKAGKEDYDPNLVQFLIAEGAAPPMLRNER